jgi:hypothetical protein
MSEETGRWQYPRPSDHDLLLCIGRDLKRLYEDTLQQSLPSDIEPCCRRSSRLNARGYCGSSEWPGGPP